MSRPDAYKRWIESDGLTKEEKEELKSYSAEEINARFFGNLEFGTAGLRGVMGLGTAMMNVYVIRHATQAFAYSILNVGGSKEKSVCICYDCRNHSKEYAEAAACVMAANGVSVRIFEDIRPTPELSFAIRNYGCDGGINITASHNPKEYNGYKVYGADGAQLMPEYAERIAKIMDDIDIFDDIRTMEYSDAVEQGLIVYMGEETDEAFLENVLSQSGKWDENELDTDFKIVYTPFHGVGYRLIPEVLRRIGVKNLCCVEEQMIPDGNFSTVRSPNPENAEGFAMASVLAEKVGAELIIGSDPDADRVGIMIKDKAGGYIPVSGNLTGVLLFDYLVSVLNSKGMMPENPVILKTIVTTEMARAVAEMHGIECIDTFTGFKYMAAKKDDIESTGVGNVVFAYEESYGYMIGDFVRDKDAVTACMLLCEMAMRYSKLGKTFEDAAEELYDKLGHYKEYTVNLYMEGIDGMRAMSALMDDLRNDPIKNISDTDVIWFGDYLTGELINFVSGENSTTDIKGSNVLRYELDDGTVMIVRPSGTEPKIKIYLLTKGESPEECDAKTDKYTAWANTLE